MMNVLALLEFAGRESRLRAELARNDARLAEALTYLRRPGANLALAAASIKAVRDRRRRVRLELDVLTEDFAQLLGRPVERTPEAEPCPASAN